MNAGFWKGRAAAFSIGLAAMGVLSGASVGSAWAQTATFPPGGPKLPQWSEMADWDGVWERGGDMVWDDRIAVGAPQIPPYNDEYLKRFNSMPLAQRIARPGQGVTSIPGRGAGVGLGAARTAGMPGIMIPLRPVEVQVNPHEVMIVTESGAIRRIYTDGRIQSADAVASAIGHSIGYWKNKELFVDTCCFSDDLVLPGGGPHSDAMHITEHFYSPQRAMLVDEISIEDPKAFTKPWTTVKTFYRRPDWELLPPDLAGGAAGPPGAPAAP